MKCPRCGSENRDDIKFCLNCGEALTDDAVRVTMRKKKKPFGKVISALVRSLLYVGILFGCQSCVISEYSAYIAVQNGASAAQDYDSLMNSINEALQYVYDNYVLVLMIANLMTILVACLFMRMRRKNPAQWLGFHMISPGRIPVCALFGVSMQYVVSVTVGLIPFPESFIESFDSQYNTLLDGNSSLALELFAVGLVAGVTEELIFRGAIMTRMKPVVGGTAAVIFSALIFGLSHGTPIAIAYATLLGFILAALFNKYNSVIPGMVFHVFYNSAAYFYPESETLTMVIYVVSIIVAVLCFIRMFVRFPNIDDVMFDGGNAIEPENEKQAYVMSRLRGFRQNKEQVTPDKLEELAKLWDEEDDSDDDDDDEEESEDTSEETSENTDDHTGDAEENSGSTDDGEEKH